jgi:hypothetical protein
MNIITRRHFLRQTGAGLATVAMAPSLIAAADEQSGLTLTPAAEIEERVRAARPLLGGEIPRDLTNRLGATHYGSHYYFTKKPFIVEGAEQIHKLGMGVLKLWLHEDKLIGYDYNSDWGIPLDGRLVTLLRHPYYCEAFALPFHTIMLEVFPLIGNKQTALDPASDYANEEEQFHEAAAHLLATYAQRDVTFILQNWEGDWMLRHNERSGWDKTPADEVKRRSETFVRFLAARQRGVERARKEAGQTKCKVYHAAEVNRVWDGTKGQGTVTTHVLPHVAVDLVSWSSYDGADSALGLWQGIELIRQHMQPSPVFGQKTVYIGEIGKPENMGATETDIIEWWDRAMGVFFAMNIPWIVHWELYCNEPKDGKKFERHVRKMEEMRGFWLIRPDGSLSYAGKYLTMLLQNAGKSLPQALRGNDVKISQ